MALKQIILGDKLRKARERLEQAQHKAEEARSQRTELETREAELTQAREEVTEEMLQTQIKLTASAFAMDMLLLKFVQGIPVVGILGGAANPVYYRKILRYVQLKYRKRYLNGLAGQK